MRDTLNDFIGMMKKKSKDLDSRQLARDCIDGLTVYAAQRARHDPVTARIKEIRSLITNLAGYWNLYETPDALKTEFLHPYHERIGDALAGEDVTETPEQRANIMFGLYMYAEDMTVTLGEEARAEIMGLWTLMREIESVWDYETVMSDILITGGDTPQRPLTDKIEAEMNRVGVTENANDTKWYVTEYVMAVENAPPLEGLDPRDGWRKISEYGNIVLGGRETPKPYYGYDFATWQYDADRKGVHSGRYDYKDYYDAKRHFVIRSGLVDSDMHFSPDQCEEIGRALSYTLDNNPDLTAEQRNTMENTMEQIERILPFPTEEAQSAGMSIS